MELNLFANILVFCLFVGFSLPLIDTADIRDYVDNFKAFTVATNETDGFRQFFRSTKTYNIPLEIIGFGKKWEGGDMHGQGGGFKINLFREAIKPYQNNDQQIIIFTDSYDVLYLCDAVTIIEKFLAFDARIVFSAESWIWPNAALADQFPIKYGYRFLNSGGFMGYANTIYEMLKDSEDLENTADDQYYYTKIYLNKDLRNSLQIKLDHKADIFQNLFSAINDVQLLPKGNMFELTNVVYDTKPCILHGNGLSKYVEFRSIGNYLAGRWMLDKGCNDCDEAIIKLESLSIHEYPRVVIAVFIEKPTPFFKEFMEKIFRQNYPKRKIWLFVRNNVPYHQEELDKLLESHKEKYAGIKVIQEADAVDTVLARHLATDYCIQKSCDSYLNVDSDAHLDNEDTLITLVKQNRSIVGPLLIRPYTAWSNFWGALNEQGYYRRSFDYMDIVNFKIKGLWNVPYLGGCYLINGTILRNAELKPNYAQSNLDFDMAFCDDMRYKDVYMYVDNRQYFGHLTDLEEFDVTKSNPNVYQLIRNRWDWEQAYLHPEYHTNFSPNARHLQPCPDVYWFPIVSARFCKEWIEIMENFGQWSDGSNQDVRLQGGYEAVPTRDIHMNQVGLNDQWMEFLRLYVTPLQEMVYIGYHHNPDGGKYSRRLYGGTFLRNLSSFENDVENPPRSLMNFVVRYKPDEQPSLRPHHDSSTYTINIALNRPNIDYEGGGCRFLRYDCKVTDMKLGWMLMHPGRLTHFHEGMLVTNGTRYIMISFIDP